MPQGYSKVGRGALHWLRLLTSEISGAPLAARPLWIDGLEGNSDKQPGCVNRQYGEQAQDNSTENGEAAR